MAVGNEPTLSKVRKRAFPLKTSQAGNFENVAQHGQQR
jgi:hypothetical protein